MKRSKHSPLNAPPRAPFLGALIIYILLQALFIKVVTPLITMLPLTPAVSIHHFYSDYISCEYEQRMPHAQAQCVHLVP